VKSLTPANWKLWLAISCVLWAIACSANTSGSRGSDPFGLDLRLGQRSSQKLIIFVHGIAGDASTSWTNRFGRSWLDLMHDDPAFQDFALVALRYNCNFTIEEVAETLRKQIEDEGVFLKFSEIYFIAHSMGGLVIKRMLATLNRPTQLDKLRRIKAALFISTPTQGAPLADIGAIFRWCNPQIGDLRPADRNAYLQSVENDWLRLIRDRAADMFPLTYGAYELRSTYALDVVTRIYAASHYDDNLYAVDEDHISIVKPADSNAPIYKWAKARIAHAEVVAREQPGRSARFVAARNTERLTRDYPLGWVLYHSLGIKVEYSVHSTADIALRAATGRSYLISPDTLLIRVPSFNVLSQRSTNYSNTVDLPAKEGATQRIAVFGDVSGWVQLLFRDQDELIWVVGFRSDR
jgi:pimeloyl-ACP methyl ester carboxylesterase